ncbi:odorant receptor 67c-like [Ceratina calcarata]|uniref:Odorant receptor 67c-like n=1 Tax=Ceratina calcarata TaxID=156304 RepID=A0AAJ7SAD7_9HYME|nr:odorant receptor 67c-like [Ceratina calcarata]
MTKETEWVTMINIARFNRKIVKMSTILCCSVVLTYTFLRFFSMKYQGKSLLLRAYFPYDVDVSPNYELTMLAQLVAAFYAAICYTAVDTFVATLILHICGQLSNLQRELKELRGPDEKDFNGRIMKIVEKHEYLNRFADMTENCFNKMLLIQILGCTVQLCFQCFQAIMPADTEENNYLLVQFLFLVLYVIYVMLQLFLYCYVGQKLSAESIAIINAAYDTEWYDMPPRDAKLLIVIMCRARLPLRITAGKFSSFTLNLYTTVH